MEKLELMEHLERLLKKAEKPGRYIGGEVNSVKKDEFRAEIRFAFAFPDVYEIGMSYTGLQILYSILNDKEKVYCERVFAPGSDMEEMMRADSVPLFSLETKTDVKKFDILGFTLQYEMSYTNILNMLDLAEIPLLSRERGAEYPLVIAGGPCAFNPEPLADFIDMFIIGDGETVLPEIVDLYGECSGRDEFLRRAAGLQGIYVPSFYEVEYNGDGTVAAYRRTCEAAPARVTRSIVDDLENAPYPEKPIVPLVEVAQDRAVVETFRGCTRGCRFCQAGMIYRPVRERSYARVMELAGKQLAGTGHDELSLLSLSTSDHSQFREIADDLADMCSERNVSLSLPSMRLDSFSFEVLEKIQRYKKSGLTFAPEAGTQRLRDIINKNITEEDIYSAMKMAIELGWKRVKLYFMMGLPGETMEDIEGIAEIAEKIMDINYQIMGRSGGRFCISVSAANFVPKPHTPFQWEPQDEDFYAKHDFLKGRLKKIKGVDFSYHDSPVSTLEAVFARGDRRTGALLLSAFRHGCKFDSWSEHFKWAEWQEAVAETGTDIGFYTTRRRDLDEIMPWDIIDSGVTKEYLLREREKAFAGETTPDCRQGCTGCGMSRLTDCSRGREEAAHV